MTSDQIIIIIIGLFTVINFIFLKNYLPSYFSQKGKNLALIDDIGKITTIVADIKTEYNKELAAINAELKSVSKTQHIIYDDERKSIIHYIDSITNFYELYSLGLSEVATKDQGRHYFYSRNQKKFR